MGFDLSSLIGGSIGDAFAKIVGCFKVPPEQALAAQTELTKIQLDLQGKLIDQVNAQIGVNESEAATGKTFIAGWRPFIGWVCGVAFLYTYVLQPLATFALAAAHVQTGPLPSLSLSDMMPVLMGMLGLGGYRTYEKVQNVQQRH